MSHTTLTIPALYDYAKNHLNIDIFSGLTVPTAIDRDALIDCFLHRSAPFECVYPEPLYMQSAISTWAKVHARTFQKWVDALAIAYDPLNNYDRTEEMQESGMEARNRNHDNNINDNEFEASNGSVDRSGKNTASTVGATNDKTKIESTTTNSVSAFDSSGWSNADKSVVGSETNADGSSMQTTSGSDSDSTTSNDSRMNSKAVSDKGTDNESALNTVQRKLRAFGNIGVTTSQQMLQSELEVAAWNLYEHITDLFLDEFCVLLY